MRLRTQLSLAFLLLAVVPLAAVTLFAYAAFLGEPPEYVLNQLIDTVLAKDKEFLTCREAHPGSHAPRAEARRPRRRTRRVGGNDATVDRSAHESATAPALAR